MIQQPVSLKFSNKADTYAINRPGYSPAVIDQIVDGFYHTGNLKAADIGAGTGISSRMLANRGLQVTAIEPDPAMILAATPHPGVTFLNRRAESTGLVSGSMDIVTSFQSFHWFDFKTSLDEFQRILKPSGKLCLIWNYWNLEDPFTNNFNTLLSQGNDYYTKMANPYAGFPSGLIKHNRIRILWKFHYLPYFRNIIHLKFDYKQTLTLDGLIGCARSQSFVPDYGEAWDRIEENIIMLMNGQESVYLQYKTNLFIGVPSKMMSRKKENP